MTTRAALYQKAAIVGLVSALASGAMADVSADEKEVKLSGCLVKAEGDDHPYLLTNAPAQPALVTPSGDVAPSSVGTTGEFRTIFYWLDGKDLQPHVGHRVEIEGDVKGDIEQGQITLDRKANWTEMTVKSDGRSLKALIPNLSVVPGDRKSDDRKGAVAVRRVAVDHVRMLAASCEP